MTEDWERKIEINFQNYGQANFVSDNGNIDAKQNNCGDVEKDKINRKKILYKKNMIRILIIIIVIVGIGSILGTSMLGLLGADSSQIETQQAGYGINDNEIIYNNGLFQKAMALHFEGNYLEAAVAYSELLGNMSNAQGYQMEEVEFWKAFAYFCEVTFGGENKYKYEAIKIFEKIANTKYEENYQIKLLSIGCLILISDDLSDVDYEKKMTDYCGILEEALINNKISSIEDYNTYNTLTISYYALAEYYVRQYTKEDSLEALTLALSYYQEALKNSRGMIKYDRGASYDSKNFEILLLGCLAKYNSGAYKLTGDEKYLLEAESCFDDIKNKVDINTDLVLYVDSMKNVAIGKIIIGNEENLEEGYKILNSLFYYMCKDEKELCNIGFWMVYSRMATEDDIVNIKQFYSQIIEKLENEDRLQEYVDVVFQVAECDLRLVNFYQDNDAWKEGYIYLLHLKNVYLNLLDHDDVKRLSELLEEYTPIIEQYYKIEILE